MKAVCKMSKKETTWPCSARGCPLYGDCLVEYEAAEQKPMTNFEKIKGMCEIELAGFLSGISLFGNPWQKQFEQEVCSSCPTIGRLEYQGRTLDLRECDFEDGVCPAGEPALWWLQQTFGHGERSESNGVLQEEAGSD